jgi:hypothetical protein
MTIRGICRDTSRSHLFARAPGADRFSFRMKAAANGRYEPRTKQ